MQSRLDTPIDDQRLTRRPYPGPAATMVTLAPLRLRLGDQPAEVPRRPGIAGRPRLRQQPLRRDPARRLLHPLRNQIPHLVEVASPTLPHRQPAGLMRFNNPAHRLVGGAADLRGPPIAALYHAKAKVTVSPCMTLEDVKKGVEEAARRKQDMQG